MSAKKEIRSRRVIRRFLFDILSRMTFWDRFKFVCMGKMNWSKYLKGE